MPRYIPNKSEVSFVEDENLFILNLANNQKILIARINGNYTWGKNGNSLLFCNEKQGYIYTYDIATKNSIRLFAGYNPEYSNNNEYIAYINVKKSDVNKNVLTIKELKTGIEWDYKGTNISYYKFSPDDNYIAVQQERPYYFNTIEIKIWSFKKDKFLRVKGNIQEGLEGYFDWK